jgi:hypothetical protein
MDAIKLTAKDRNVKKQEIYDIYHGKEWFAWKNIIWLLQSHMHQEHLI